MAINRILGSAALAAFLLTGCATSPPGGSGEGINANDPFEPTNRAVFQASLALDKLVVRPTAIVYRSVLPQRVRDMLRNFLNNLDTPVIFVNDVLQGELNRAGITLVRAGVNTTIGGGFFEVAEDWGYPRHSEDFGQTLAVWGVGEGPYIFLPLVGPGNPRDLIGRGVDILFDPLTYVQWGNEIYVPYTRAGVDALDIRARNIETLDDIENMSADFYASVRSLYRQTRNNEIKNGETEVEDLPDF